MKKGIIAVIALIACCWSASAQDDGEPLFAKKGPLPQIVGVDFMYPQTPGTIKRVSKDDKEFLVTTTYAANVFYERGSMFRLKFEAGATMIQGPTDTDATRNVPAIGGTVLVGYPFVGFQQRTYVLGYFGVGLAGAPSYGLFGRMLFDLRLSHYISNRLGLNALARFSSYAGLEGDLPISIGAGLSYML